MVRCHVGRRGRIGAQAIAGITAGLSFARPSGRAFFAGPGARPRSHCGAEQSDGMGHSLGCIVAVKAVDGPVLSIREGMGYPGIQAPTEEGLVALP